MKHRILHKKKKDKVYYQKQLEEIEKLKRQLIISIKIDAINYINRNRLPKPSFLINSIS